MELKDFLQEINNDVKLANDSFNIEVTETKVVLNPYV